jgi:hypothetical protein
MPLLKQIRKILKNSPPWAKYPLVVPKDLYDLAKKNSSVPTPLADSNGKA